MTAYRSRDGRTVTNDDNDTWLLPTFAEMYRLLKEHSLWSASMDGRRPTSSSMVAGGRFPAGGPRRVPEKIRLGEPLPGSRRPGSISPGTLDVAIWGAELATGHARERIYTVDSTPASPISLRTHLGRRDGDATGSNRTSGERDHQLRALPA